jgi:pimeloyl-ACP methyl ester carboxylesterase
MDSVWQTLQQELAQTSPTGTFWIAEHSGHYIHVDEPEVVVTAVVDLLQRIRSASEGLAAKAAPLMKGMA